MLITKNLLREDPWVAICDMINEEFNYQLDHTTTVLETFTVLNPQDIKIKISRQLGTYSGNLLPKLTVTEFTYRRLPLSYINEGATVLHLNTVELPLNSYQLAKLIADDGDIVLTKEDIVFEPIDNYSTLYTLKASPNSLRFYGTATISVSNTNKTSLGQFMQLRQPLTNTIDNAANQLQSNGSALVYTVDFSKHREYLRTVGGSNGYPDAIKLSGILQDVTGKGFRAVDGIRSNNITDQMIDGFPIANVIYNGPLTPEYTRRKDITHVLVIKLNPDYCLEVAGWLLIHYE